MDPRVKWQANRGAEKRMEDTTTTPVVPAQAERT